VHEPTPQQAETASDQEKHPLLVSLGDKVRELRTRRPMTRKALAQAADVSERHLANLEYGTGNASILILHQVAQALQCSLAELIGDMTTRSAEWLLIRELLAEQDEAGLRKARMALTEMLATHAPDLEARKRRIALIGLRGAGKTTLGQMLAEHLDLPFIELSREIEILAGSPVSEIQAMFGVNGYRRYERRALDQVIQTYPHAVIATPGGLVADPGSFSQLLQHCTTIWLKADPADHMNRVTEQGDLRPIAASQEAMEDLKAILAGRSAFYSKAEYSLNTSGQSLEQAFAHLKQIAQQAAGQASRKA
jgi:XRE family transcriptional regulator, aerobic/anaerobic benzoate catabolism transcriptional regulator